MIRPLHSDSGRAATRTDLDGTSLRRDEERQGVAVGVSTAGGAPVRSNDRTADHLGEEEDRGGEGALPCPRPSTSKSGSEGYWQCCSSPSSRAASPARGRPAPCRAHQRGHPAVADAAPPDLPGAGGDRPARTTDAHRGRTRNHAPVNVQVEYQQGSTGALPMYGTSGLWNLRMLRLALTPAGYSDTVPFEPDALCVEFSASGSPGRVRQ